MAEAVKAKLEASNYDVRSRTAARRRWRKSQTALPDLMILDVYMPGIDGFEVCRRLREDPATQSLPIVMLSSRGNIKEKLAGFRAGADDYLVKDSICSTCPTGCAWCSACAGWKPIDVMP